MIARYPSFLLVLFWTMTCSAQIANSVWYFGDHAGLRFSDGPPVVLFDNALASNQAMGSYCDQNADVVLYSNVLEVFNGQHQQVPNGTGFTFAISSPNPFVLPLPGVPDHFLIFNFIAPNDTFVYRMHVHEVDMARNGGQGEVIVHDSLFHDSVLSAIVAVPHCSGIGHWIVIHEQVTDRFLSFHFDSTGTSAVPVVSAVGDAIGTTLWSADHLQISPQLDRLVFSYRRDTGRHLAVLNFDNCTGTVSDPIPIGTGEYFLAPQFSPNGNVLYATSMVSVCDTSGTQLWQYDLSSGDSTQIRASRTLIHHQPFQLGCKGGMLSSALALNGMIYVAHWDTACIGVVAQPDVLGPGCNFTYCGQDLGGRRCYSGLPHLAKCAHGPNSLGEDGQVKPLLHAYPVPATDGLWVENAPFGRLELTDMQGRTVHTRSTTPHDERIWVPRAGLPSGCYVLRATSTSGNPPEYRMVVFR